MLPIQAKTNPHPRLTVVGNVYHEDGTGSPKSCPLNFVQLLKSQEPTEAFMLRVGSEWTPLVVGSDRRASVIVLCNHEGADRQTYPTPEEKAATAARVVQLGVQCDYDDGYQQAHFVQPFARVAPGQQQPLYPADLALLRVRCVDPAGGTATCAVWIMPE